MKDIAGWRVVLFLGMIVLCTGCGPGAAGRNEGITLTMGYFPDLTHTVALVGVGSGIFQRELGRQIQLHTQTFNAGPAEIQALLAGSIDIAFVGPTPAINGYIHSHGSALRVIAGASSGGVFFIVRADAGIRSPADLADKKIADPQKGGTQDLALRHYLRVHRLQSSDQGGTVHIISTSNASILSLFKEGQLDGAWVPQPWATRLVLEAAGRVFLDERALWPGGQFATTIVAARQAFYSSHPEVVKRFLQADIDTVEYIRSRPAEAEQIANQQIKASNGASVQALELALAFQSIQVTYDPLISTIAQQVDRLYTAGFLASRPDLAHLSLLTLLNEVLAARGLATVATS
ncbi:MAG TPA: ABC transporter substrate-binding protein [Ktedonobacteraceae bacterium]|jgi:NitT/TauT family transport system substrate-binding protein